MELTNLPDKEFKAKVIKMLTRLQSRMDALREDFNRFKKSKKESDMKIIN